jgi:hypothetical protein
MSDEKKIDGGPAFPRPAFESVIDSRFNDYGTNGMSLRDYFAAKAMAAIITTQPYPNGIIILGIVSDAYLIADEMLKAREQ